MRTVVIAALAVASFALKSDSEGQLSSSKIAYESFRRDFGVQRPQEGAPDYLGRVALFERRREEVQRHNTQSNPGWLKAVNKFADYTDAEFYEMLGHRHSRRGRPVDAPAPRLSSSFVQSMPEQKVAQAVDWRQKLNATTGPKDQGACGSCWAVAAAGAMETHAEMAGQSGPEVSFEQLVDCVPNPSECGGTGGCQGATSELAFEYIAKHGIGRAKDYKGYLSNGDGKCKPPSHAALTAKEFVRLPENDQYALQAAVSTQGPVVVSADASGWMSYGSGVFKGCGKNAVINHAILMMGYGTDDKSNEKFWLIRNSWGPSWGENGFIRMLRHEEGESFCGVDRKPLDGVGCKGGPPTLPVCGMCGVLSDSAYPTGVEIAKVV